jgi:methionyl-tRNA formyltransferase
MAVRVVFFGNSVSTFSARYFGALLDTPCHLVGVVDVPSDRQSTTNPLQAGLLNFAKEADNRSLPVYQPADPNLPGFADKFAGLEPDLFLAAGYAIILKEQLLSVPRLLAVNFHASLLPYYRGKHPVFWALRNNEKWSGLTVHVMDPGIDTGDVIYQTKVRTRKDDTVVTLYERIIDSSENLVGRLIAGAEHNNLPRKSQPKHGGSYYSSMTNEDFQFDWQWSAEKIRRYITISPGKCFTILRGERVYFFNAQLVIGAATSTPGTLLTIKRERAAISTGSGTLSSSMVRMEAGEMESFAGYCRRKGFQPGEMLA